jgi:D-alanine-D-alanine ligase
MEELYKGKKVKRKKVKDNMKNQKRTIAIVCGGDSSEHDVSLRSAQGLYSFFDKERYNVFIVDMK